MAQNRNLFRLSRFILLKLPPLFKFFSKFRKSKKRLLIIKIDAIGDYVLFRNFIEVICNADQYRDYEIDLVGNQLWKGLALSYDADFINEVFFVKPDDLYYHPLQTLKLGWRLYKKNYHIVLQPTFARTFAGDGIAGFTAAKQIIGFEGDYERIAAKYKAKTDRFYTEKLLLPEAVYFEFDKTRFFFESVLKQAIELKGPFIQTSTVKTGIVIFPGAGVFKRSWEADKFLALIKLIMQQTGQIIYVAGGPAEIGIGDYLEKNLPAGTLTNLIDNTSLLQLTELIGTASLVISNETSAIHIAAATQTNTVCILGGGHFSRFAPYPAYMVNKPVCVYEKMECYYCNWSCKFITADSEPYPCISNVSVASVWLAVQPFIAQM